MATANPKLIDVEELQVMTLAFATGGTADPARYRELRRELFDDPAIRENLPRFIATCRELSQFWPFIQSKFAHYRDRRKYIWDEFAPLLDFLEKQGGVPSDKAITDTFLTLEVPQVQRSWERALGRRTADPEGAITAARSLLETICKCILDKELIEYEQDWDLPKLYRTVTETL